MPEPRIAAQLYTLRDYLTTPEDIRRHLPRVRELGYRAVQRSAVGPMPPEAFRALCDDLELDIVATHVSLPAILNDTERVVAEHRTYGCRHVGIGGLGFGGDLKDPAALRQAVDQLNEAAAKLFEAGLSFSYHNHHHEFEPVGEGERRMPLLQHLIQECDESVCFEIDTYWVQAGGGDPADWIDRVSGRCPLLHYKDMTIRDRQQHFAPVGLGNLNWPAINRAARAADALFVIVEQDRCEVEPTDPFDALGASFRNLLAMGFDA